MLFLIFFYFQFFYAADTLTSYQTLLDHKESSNFFHKYLFIQKNNPDAAPFDFSGNTTYFVKSCDFKYINNKWQGVVSYKQKNGPKYINFFEAQENPKFQDYEFMLICDCDERKICDYCIKFKSCFSSKLRYFQNNVALYKNKKGKKRLYYYDSLNTLKIKDLQKDLIISQDSFVSVYNSKIVLQNKHNDHVVYDLDKEKVSAFTINDRSIVCKDNAFYCGRYSFIEVLNSNEIYLKQYHVNGEEKIKLLFKGIFVPLISVKRDDQRIELIFKSGFSLCYDSNNEDKFYIRDQDRMVLEEFFQKKYFWVQNGQSNDLKNDLNCNIDNKGNIQVRQENASFVSFPLYTTFFKRITFKKIILKEDFYLYLETNSGEIFLFDQISKSFFALKNSITYDPVDLSWMFNSSLFGFKDFVPESWLYRKWLNLKQKFIAAKITVKNYCNTKIDSFMTYVFSFLEKNIHESKMPLKHKIILLSLLRTAKV